MALVREFRLVEARDNLRELVERLAAQEGPVARDERARAASLADELATWI